MITSNSELTVTLSQHNIRILIADDHPLFRLGLSSAVRQNTHIEVVAEAADGETALTNIADLDPDVAVLDIDMPKLNGLGVAREMRLQKLRAQIVFLTAHDGEDLFDSAMDLGANAYLLKDSALTEISVAIEAVAAGDFYVTPTMTAHLIKRRARSRQLAKGFPGLEELTPIERRIIQMVAANKSSRDIADALGLQPRTVENRRTAICDKLGLHGPNALLKFVLEHRSQIADVSS